MTLNKNHLRLALFLYLSCLNFAWATEEQNSLSFERLGFTAGTLTEFPGSMQTDGSGSTQKFEFNPLLAFSTDIALADFWSLSPEFGYVLPRTTPEGGVTKHLLMIRADAIYYAQDWIRLRVGSSLMLNHMRGKGGTVEMRNGNATSTFYVPSENKTSINNTLDLGAEAFLEKTWGIRFQTYWYALFNQDKRNVSYALDFTYYYELGK